MYYPLTILGQEVTLNTWGCNLTNVQESWVVNTFRLAAVLLNGIPLPFLGTPAINQVHSLITPSDNSADLGATDNGMTLSVPYLQSFSVQWFASLFAHEGQHHLNKGLYSGADLWKDEESACQTQRLVAVRVGMPKSELLYLDTWMDPKNAAAMEAHMTGGYAGPPRNA